MTGKKKKSSKYDGIRVSSMYDRKKKKSSIYDKKKKNLPKDDG